eukprot:6546506-Heterocapsa_arctica.AAC.1
MWVATRALRRDCLHMGETSVLRWRGLCRASERCVVSDERPGAVRCAPLRRQATLAAPHSTLISS